MLYSRKLFKISFFIIIGKNFKSLLNLFQIYGPKNGMLFWAKLLFYQRCLQSQMWSSFICISEGDKKFIYIELWSSLPIFDFFLATRCSNLSFDGSQF